MNRRSIILLIIFSLFLLPASLSALTMEQALDQAAKHLGTSLKDVGKGHNLVIQVVNYQSQRADQTAKSIENKLYFALETYFPGVKLILMGESLAGISSRNTIFVKGSYELKAKKTTVRLQALKGTITGEILAQAEATFSTQKARRKTLVAVLDIEAETLNKTQIKAFSDIFRTALGQLRVFDIASSADVDKMNPDAIQKATGCTRDECATIIGEQLGMDRVISISMFKVSEGMYVLSAKIMDIKDGSILVSKTVEHNGDFRTLKVALEILAAQLAGKPSRLKTQEVVKKETSSSNTIWHITAITMALASTATAAGEATKYADLETKNTALSTHAKGNITQTDYDATQATYKSNQDQMKKYKSNIQTYNGVTAVFVIWESYLMFFGGSSGGQAQLSPQSPANFNFAVLPSLTPGKESNRVTFQWNW